MAPGAGLRRTVGAAGSGGGGVTHRASSRGADPRRAGASGRLVPDPSPVRHRMNGLGIGLTVAGAAVVALLVLAWRFQERIVFQPQPPPYPPADGARIVSYTAEDGQPLRAYLVGDGSADGDCVLGFHGNADLAVRQVGWARELARRTGALVVMAEYRGYGGLPGAPSYTGSQRDARAAYAFARDTLGCATERMVLFGHSLGSAVAVELAADVHPRALILQSPFTSARDMARRFLAGPLLLVWSWVTRVHFDTVARVRALDVPVWVVHGTRDMIVPARMGDAVFAAARRQGELLHVPGAGHNDVPHVGGEAYWRWLARAVRGR